MTGRSWPNLLLAACGINIGIELINHHDRRSLAFCLAWALVALCTLQLVRAREEHFVLGWIMSKSDALIRLVAGKEAIRGGDSTSHIAMDLEDSFAHRVYAHPEVLSTAGDPDSD